MKRTARAGSEWTVLARRFPLHELARLGAYLGIALAITLITAWIFATEPDTLDSGESNPLVYVPHFTAGVALFGAIPVAVPLFRQPRLCVNHYGIQIRPRAFRELLVPWIHIEEIAAVTVGGRRGNHSYLLFACDGHAGSAGGDRPHFTDRAVLREANRATEGLVGGFDLAIRLRDFKSRPQAALAEVAAFAPGHVDVVDRLVD